MRSVAAVEKDESERKYEKFHRRESSAARTLKFYGICFSFGDDGKRRARNGIMRAETQSVVEEIKQSAGLLRRAL
jgi:hypothetical protein